PLAIRLTTELRIEKLELVARGKDRARPRGGASPVAHRRLEAERDHDGARARGRERVDALRFEEARTWRQVVERARHAWTCRASLSSAPYIDSIGSSSRIASS